MLGAGALRVTNGGKDDDFAACALLGGGGFCSSKHIVVVKRAAVAIEAAWRRHCGTVTLSVCMSSYELNMRPDNIKRKAKRKIRRKIISWLKMHLKI